MGLTKTGLVGLDGITRPCVAATCVEGSWLIWSGARAAAGCTWAAMGCLTGVAACDDVVFSA